MYWDLTKYFRSVNQLNKNKIKPSKFKLIIANLNGKKNIIIIIDKVKETLYFICVCLPSVYAYESGSCPIFSSITYYLPGLLVDMLYASFSKNTDLYFCIVRNPTPSCFFFTFGSWFLEIPEKPYCDYHDNRCDRKSNDIWPSYATVNPDLSIYLFIYIFIYLFIDLFIYLFICLFIFQKNWRKKIQVLTF